MITSSCKNIQVKLISKCSLKKEDLLWKQTIRLQET